MEGFLWIFLTKEESGYGKVRILAMNLGFQTWKLEIWRFFMKEVNE